LRKSESTTQPPNALAETSDGGTGRTTESNAADRDTQSAQAVPSGTTRSATAETFNRPDHLGFGIKRIWQVLLLEAATLGLSTAIIAPYDHWYIAYFCMVPWLVVIGGTDRARRVYVTSWLLGLAFYLINVLWIEACTGPAYFALAAYLACYYPLAAWAIRHAVRRRRVPLSIAFPVVWVGAEFLRTQGFIAFPWFFLGHSHHTVPVMIQISDLVGAYGVTLVLAAVNGAIADWIFSCVGSLQPTKRTSQCRRALFGAVFAALLVVATLAYGMFRLSQDTITEGPRIAILQQDYPNYTDRERAMKQPRHNQKAAAYFELMNQARESEPDLYLFPETAWSMMYLNRAFLEADPKDIRSDYLRVAQKWSKHYYERLQDWSNQNNASIVIGSASVTPTPLSLRAPEILHNSAYHFRPGNHAPQRHDKIHPVLFGEMVPFRYSRLRFLYLFFNSLSPFGQGGFDYSLTPGQDVEVFTVDTRDGRGSFNFGAPICYEDVMPYVCRRFAYDPQNPGKRVDFLLNISNDGWFLHGHELPQHFAICTFRAIENRVGIARAVNTGVSGFIDPNGRPYQKIGVAQTGFRVARVMKDSRKSLYSATGDVFALLCGLLWVAFCIDYILVRTFGGEREEDS
jgi:apolipoprotein N-acyltransferase